MTKYFITYVIGTVIDYGLSEGEDVHEAIQKFCDQHTNKIKKMYVCALDDVYKPFMEMYYGRNDNNNEA